MKKLLFPALFLLVGVVATPALAADLPPSLHKIISAAAARDNTSGQYQYLDVALVLIGESHPDHAAEAVVLYDLQRDGAYGLPARTRMTEVRRLR